MLGLSSGELFANLLAIFIRLSNILPLTMSENVRKMSLKMGLWRLFFLFFRSFVEAFICFGLLGGPGLGNRLQDFFETSCVRPRDSFSQAEEASRYGNFGPSHHRGGGAS